MLTVITLYNLIKQLVNSCFLLDKYHKEINLSFSILIRKVFANDRW